MMRGDRAPDPKVPAMPIAARCPHCLAELRARDDLAGRPVRCTNCRGLLTLPGEPAAARPRGRGGRPTAAQGGSKLPLLLIAGGAVLLLGCVVCGGAGYYFLAPVGDGVTTQPTSPVAETVTPKDEGNTVAPAPAPTAPAPKRPKLGEPVATVSAVELSGEFLKDPAAAATRYAGKVVRVRGSAVGRVGDDTLAMEGEFDPKGKGRRLVNCKVHPADHAALADVKARTTVAVVGKCTGLTKATSAVALTDCLLEP